MDAQTPPIPTELLAVAQASPTIAELLRRLARGEPGAPLSLAQLVRRLHDGTATADEEHARPLLAYMRKGLHREAHSVTASLQRDRRKADFFLAQVLMLPADNAYRDGLSTVLRRNAWRRADGFDLTDKSGRPWRDAVSRTDRPLPPHLWRLLRQSVWREAQTVLVEWLDADERERRVRAGVLWRAADARRRASEALRHAAETEYAERLYGTLTWSPDGAENRIRAQNELTRMRARVQLTARQEQLWRLVGEMGMPPADALRLMGEDCETMPLWKSLKQKLQRVCA